MSAWWTEVQGKDLAQGDVLNDCLVPMFTGRPGEDEEAPTQDLVECNLIVVTQSCDLENRKVKFVALCNVLALQSFEEINPIFSGKGQWENVRKGRYEGLHLLASPENPADNRSALVIDFGQIVSLPFDYLTVHAESRGRRWRLQSPFLEHFSQAFARFFMRVGLPTDIPPFK